MINGLLSYNKDVNKNKFTQKLFRNQFIIETLSEIIEVAFLHILIPDYHEDGEIRYEENTWKNIYVYRLLFNVSLKTMSRRKRIN